MFEIVGIAGSLRERSFNRALLRAAAARAPEGVTISIFDLAGVPLYNADLDGEVGGGATPEPVVDLRNAIRRADAVLLATAEYNWGPSGVIKNAIDWASRPAATSALVHKPIAIMGTSPGPAGTGRAQLILRQNLLFTRSYVLVEPVVALGGAVSLFDDNLELVDDEAQAAVLGLVEALVRWAERLRA
jgi:chromate reductase, NAD(P)H dehydrogenase (quinone)